MQPLALPQQQRSVVRGPADAVEPVVAFRNGCIGVAGVFDHERVHRGPAGPQAGDVDLGHAVAVDVGGIHADEGTLAGFGGVGRLDHAAIFDAVDGDQAVGHNDHFHAAVGVDIGHVDSGDQ